MGTRSITVFREGKENLCAVYRQMDGYPEGMGQDLHEMLKGHTLCNGFTMADREGGKAHNGMGCLAAYVIGKLKDGQIGSIYVTRVSPAYLNGDTFNHKNGHSWSGAAYGYIISDKDGNINLKVVEIGWKEPSKVLFDGPIDKADFKGEEFQTAKKLANSA